MPIALNAEEIDKLRRNFKRCGDGTINAILEFRQSGDLATVPIITQGIINRYLRDEARQLFASATAETQLSTLGVDSLTMLEIILDVQEALDISIEDSELKRLLTIGDVNQLLAEKTAYQGGKT